MKPPKKSNQPMIAIVTVVSMLSLIYLDYHSAQVKREAERKAETRNR